MDVGAFFRALRALSLKKLLVPVSLACLSQLVVIFAKWLFSKIYCS